MKKNVDPSDFSGLMQDILHRCKQQGASDAVVGINHDSGLSVDVRMRDVETVLFHEDKGVSVTVYFGHQKGSASSTDLSVSALDNLIRAACDIAKVSAVDPCFGLAEKELMSKQHPDLDLYYPWDITSDEAVKQALICEEHALSLDPRIKNSDGVNLSTYTFKHGYANTHGAEGIVKGSRHSLSCSLIAETDGKMQRDYDYTNARRHEDLIASTTLAKSAVERTTSRLGARKIKTGKVPVIFSSRCSSSLMSAFVGAISGGNLYRKNSFLLDSVGVKVFPHWMHIEEHPRILRGLGSASFDGDGVPTRQNVFVRDGIVQQYILSTYSARRLGLQTTANSDGVHNLTVQSNAGDLAALIKNMGRGLLVTEMMGQGVNLITGDYSRGASGFWVEQGEIQHAVEEITIAGNLRDIFLNIQAVGNDVDRNLPTQCGSIWINDMMLGGA